MKKKVFENKLIDTSAIKIIGVILLVVIIAVAIFGNNNSSNTNNKTEINNQTTTTKSTSAEASEADGGKAEADTQTTTSNSANTETPSSPAGSEAVDLQDIIEKIVKSYDSKFEVTIYGGGGSDSFGNSSNMPWDVFVNSELNRYHDCFGAKTRIFDIMKELYTNKDTKSAISTLTISLSDQAQAGLGSKDANSLSRDDWNNSGPTNFAKSLDGTGTSETFWRSINGNCNP